MFEPIEADGAGEDADGQDHQTVQTPHGAPSESSLIQPGRKRAAAGVLLGREHALALRQDGSQ
jgi:hypothetical protein